MTGFILRRLGESLLAIWGVVTIVFFVTRILGDPAALLLPIGASDADIQALRGQLGLDQPMLVQYGQFLLNAVQGDFGVSFQHGRDAMQVVLERLPATAQLALTAIAMGLVIGTVAGSIAALKRGRAIELVVMAVALLGQATPVFWLGIMLILFFAVNLGWLPTGGYGTLAHLVLPAFTLAVFVSASIARLLRSSMLEILKEDYIRTAKAKGLLRHTVFFWHVARNALIPVVTMTAILTGELLGGSVVTETVFSWPGIGRLIIQAIEAKDFPVIQAGITLIAAIFVLINFLVDLLYGVLDPRIRANR
ncbi:Glutathione transport system permease protein GsiC [Pseudooceanicola marinus]|uniref:Glutathione transport system permease protein GsiC n=1 Tax=Pseudooceanicola marinus TaxID=396013 RepID=A0A1X6Y811_9RHOB|nr:ABC transporter permease [Pseudooceanicola marinus]PJE33199.1 ABC transporter permease [Pseudooceanicola marinus]SLN13514.1 Glutathione transport system permease protein GsiC [Pseudooceanicola marinus]